MRAFQLILLLKKDDRLCTGHKSFVRQASLISTLSLQGCFLVGMRVIDCGLWRQLEFGFARTLVKSKRQRTYQQRPVKLDICPTGMRIFRCLVESNSTFSLRGLFRFIYMYWFTSPPHHLRGIPTPDLFNNATGLLGPVSLRKLPVAAIDGVS